MVEGLHLSPRHRKEIVALLHKHLPGVEVWAYGSRVNGRSHDGSDLDLVLRGPKLAEIDISRLAGFIEALQDSTIPFLVEARDWARLPESFHHEIEREHVVLVERENCSSLAREWSTATIEDISEKVAMGPFGSSIKVSTFVPDGVPIISGQHLHGVRVDDSPGFNFISHEHAQRLANANVKRGDIVFTHRGNIGQAAYIPNSSMFDRYVISQSQFYMRCDRSTAIPEFIALFFKSPEGRHKLLANASQVGVPSIARPVTYLRTLEISIPPLPEQRAIAHILGTLDDKIELNRRMNETLEAMARALFKSWFVDFDPVRAKMAGCDTGLPQHLADLFPDRFVESELGKIPEGWEVKTFSECVEVVRGLSYKGSGLSSDGVPMHNLNSIYEGGGYKHDGLKGYDGEHKSQHVVRAGDLIVANTEQGHDRLLIGYAAIVPTSFVNETLFSHHIYRVRPKDCMALTSNYLCQLLNTRVMHEIVSGFANGTTVNMLPVDALQTPQLIVPAKPILAAFNDLAEAAHKRHEGMIDESRTLAALRDALLPNLISGELRVRGAKRFIARTT